MPKEKKPFKITESAPRELRRHAKDGIVLLTDEQAEYELLRNTVVDATPPAAAAPAEAVTAGPEVPAAKQGRKPADAEG